MWGLAGQESGWNYYARNPHSGAFGRYQIMPANWNSWARRYLGRGWRDQSALNQELVARAKIGALYGWLGDWDRVAYWWLIRQFGRRSSALERHREALREQCHVAHVPRAKGSSTCPAIPPGVRHARQRAVTGVYYPEARQDPQQHRTLRSSPHRVYVAAAA